MPSVTLTHTGVQPQLQHASSAALATRLRTQWPSIRTSVQSNPLTLDSADDRWWRNAFRNGTAENGQLLDYLCLSVFGHLDDAWNYVTASSRALLAGDLWTATHLGYYAELRAAASMLAASGIGIINIRSFLVGTSGAVLPINASNHQPCKLGTHKAIWPVLSAWSATSHATRILGAVQIAGISVGDIANHMSLPIQSSFADLMDELGIDLQLVSKDHLVRNRSSYNPTACMGISSSAGATSDILARAWQTVDESQFVERTGIELLLRSKGDPLGPERELFLEKLKFVIIELGGSASEQDLARWKSFASSPRLPETKIRAELNASNFWLGTWSRAFQLCLLAIVSARWFLRQATIHDPAITLEPWWGFHGERSGLFVRSSMTELADLAADIAVQAQAAHAANANAPRDHFDLWALTEANGPKGIGVFGRVGLLGAYS